MNGWIGAALPRKEDRRMLLGRGRFVGDLTRPGLLHAAFVRSPHAHALVNKIDGAAASQAPGVEGLFTAESLGHPFLLAMLERDEFVPTAMPILAGDKVRFVGEPVAVVIADDAYRAEDAAELVEVDWHPQPVVTSMETATAAGAPRLHDHGNCLVDLLMFDDDGLPQIFAEAKTTVSATFASARVAALPLEGRACLAEWDDRDDQLVMHVSTQVPHQVRSGVAQALGLPERSIRVIAPDVGGGFGLKCVVDREEVAVAAAALRLRRPVRWTEDRQENLTAAFHGHEQSYRVKAAFDAEGKILGLDAEIDCDTGACFSERVVEDCGVVINPMVVDGQVRGGVAQGAAAALLERVSFDSEGQPVSATLMDYLAPTAAEMCAVEIVHLQTPSRFSETGAKGMGEGGTIGAPAAVLGAINDALSDTDVRFDHIPVLPQDLSAALNGAARGALDIFGMTKVPVWNRDLLAGMLGVDETLIRVHAIDAGGGFGVRGEFYPEDFLIPWLAMKLGRPVKWAEDRTEHLMAANHSRQQYHRVAAAFDADGRILGLTDDITHDNGAYCRTHGVAVPELTAAMLPGPYRVPAYRGRVRVVLTNKTPCGTYRAPGRFEGTAAREHLLDVAAAQLGIDPVLLRMRNLLTADEMPHERPISTLGTDLILDTGNYPALLAAAVKEADRLGYRTQAGASARASACSRRRGFGVAMFVEKSGLGPQETADVTVSKSGAVHVYSGGTSVGQGIETVLAQITGDALGVDPRAVRVTAGDTAAQPFGSGSWASRSTVVGGSAVHQAAAAVRERAIELAGRILEVAGEDLELADGAVSVRGDPAVRLSLADIARAAAPASGYLEGRRASRAVGPPPVRGLAHDLPLRSARRGGGG